jgi:hypothetical protein
MAQLSSPGVSVTVIDESFYTPAAPGTTPLLIVASAENKQNGAGTGTAPGTLAANAGKVYLMTSQKDLADTFGTPVFKTDANNNPIHAGEQNEYGLQAAYSYLGVSNRAYVVRAPIDLAQLDARASAPAGEPEDGQVWFDTANSNFGIFQWNSAQATTTAGQTFANRVPVIITETSKINGSTGAPLDSIGAIGEYAVVGVNSIYTIWYKKPQTATAAGTWVAVGTPQWKASWPAATSTLVVGSMTLENGATFTIKAPATYEYTISRSQDASAADALAGLVSAINAQTDTHGISAAINTVSSRLELYSTGASFSVEGGAATGIGISSVVTGEQNPRLFFAPALQMTPHFQVPSFKRSENATTIQGYPTGSIWVKTTVPNLGARWRVKVYNAQTGGFNELSAPIYASNTAALAGLDPAGGGLSLPIGALYVKSNVEEELVGGFPELASFKIYARRATGATSIRSVANAALTAGSNSFTISESVKGSANVLTHPPVTFTVSGNAGTSTFASALTAALANSRIAVDYDEANNLVTLRHLDGGDIYFVDGTASPIVKLFPTATTTNMYASATGTAGHFVASLWSPNADIVASNTAPTTEAVDGQLWYSSIVDEVDLMVHNGTRWCGYRSDESQYRQLDADRVGYAPIVSATRPSVNGKLDGDIWVDTSSLEQYPRIYKFNGDTLKWVLVDSTDQTTQDGILFADARWAVNGGSSSAQTNSTIPELLVSDFLDFDAPDPALYPKGMLLWNLRRSGFNVKRFVRNYVDIAADNIRFNNSEPMASYYPHRWVSESANQEDGSGTFGRKAQRRVVIQSLQALVNANQEIRDEESRVFNLLACPGYPELIGELVSLNFDRGLTAFIVGDTPPRLTPDATSLSNWGNNTAGALEDNDQGLVSSDEYLGIFYPWGFTSDNIGNNIAVPPSHMMLRTIALSDQVSYPWFAPAGTRRGGITNATAVGYITDEGEFQSVALNTGQRDTLASIKVNPITFITGTGLVNYGQFTRARNASALDRINVARLVIFLRRQFAQLAKPYVFEPNDKITRDEIKGAAENLLLELVGQRALYDYIVVCDTSNNTPARIDRNELYLDVAIEPVKAVEFIYIPLRLKNTGEIQGLAQ